MKWVVKALPVQKTQRGTFPAHQEGERGAKTWCRVDVCRKKDFGNRCFVEWIFKKKKARKLEDLEMCSGINRTHAWNVAALARLVREKRWVVCQVLCAALKLGAAVGRVNVNASIRRYAAAFPSAPPRRVGAHSPRKKRRNRNSWRMPGPSSGDAGGRRREIALFSKHLKVTFSFQAAIFRGALESLSSASH